jgi:hypothetical protein
LSVAVTRALVPFQGVVQPLVRIEHIDVSLDRFVDVYRGDVIVVGEEVEGIYGSDGRPSFCCDKGVLIDCFV